MVPLDTMNIYGSGLVTLMFFRIFKHFLEFYGVRTYLGFMTLQHIQLPVYVPWHKEQEYTWFRSRDLNSFHDIWVLPVFGGGDHSRGSCPTYYMMNLDTSNKNISVEVSTVFKMFSNFLFREGLLLLLLLLGYAYHLMRHAKTNKNINGLRITIQ